MISATLYCMMKKHEVWLPWRYSYTVVMVPAEEIRCLFDEFDDNSKIIFVKSS